MLMGEKPSGVIYTMAQAQGKSCVFVVHVPITNPSCIQDFPLPRLINGGQVDCVRWMCRLMVTSSMQRFGSEYICFGRTVRTLWTARMM